MRHSSNQQATATDGLELTTKVVASLLRSRMALPNLNFEHLTLNLANPREGHLKKLKIDLNLT